MPSARTMIRRGKHKTNFVVLPNSMLKDGRLSAASKGTLAYLLSRPRGWEVRHDALRRTMKLGRKAFATVMRNLIAAGYARRSKEQRRADDNTFIGYDYDVFDEAEPVDEQGAVVPFAAAGMRHRRGNNGNKKEEIKDSNTNVPLPLNGSVLAERSCAFPLGTQKSEQPRGAGCVHSSAQCEHHVRSTSRQEGCPRGRRSAPRHSRGAIRGPLRDAQGLRTEV